MPPAAPHPRAPPHSATFRSVEGGAVRAARRQRGEDMSVGRSCWGRRGRVGDGSGEAADKVPEERRGECEGVRSRKGGGVLGAPTAARTWDPPREEWAPRCGRSGVEGGKMIRGRSRAHHTRVYLLTQRNTDEETYPPPPHPDKGAELYGLRVGLPFMIRRKSQNARSCGEEP